MKRSKKKTEIHYYVAELRGTHFHQNGNRFVELLLDGEEVELQREPRNVHDKNAIGIHWWPPADIADRLRVARGTRHKIGYVAREIAALLKGATLLRASFQRQPIGGKHMVKIHVAVKV